MSRRTLPGPLLLVLSLLTAPIAAVGVPDHGGLRAGVGRAEVTPPVGTAQWGYGDRSCVLNPTACVDQRVARPGDTEAYSEGA